jgi:hypothetical protein
MNPINTVNVIEFDGETILGLASYPDTPEGNKAAEERFKAVAKENGVHESDLEAAIEDGVADNYMAGRDDSWRLVIYHSTVGSRTR